MIYFTLLLLFLYCINAERSSLTDNLTPMYVALYSNIYAYTVVLNVSDIVINSTNTQNYFTKQIVAVVDTGSSGFTLLSVNDTGTCLTQNPFLEKDMSNVVYNSTGDSSTAYGITLVNSSDVTIASINQSTFIDACSFYAQETQLHDWTYGLNTSMYTPSDDNTVSSNGLLGMSYCTTATTVSTVDDVTVTYANDEIPENCVFMGLLNEVTNSTAFADSEKNWIFGLDLNLNLTIANYLSMDVSSSTTTSNAGDNSISMSSASSSAASTMQLGGISPVYESILVTTQAPLPSSALYSHSVMIFNLILLCDNAYNDISDSSTGINIFTNYSSSYPMVIDTGSVGLTLPLEFYNTVMAWVNVTSSPGLDVDTFAGTLPSLRFQLSDALGESTESNFNPNYFYIPLANLLVHKNSSVDHSLASNPGIELYNPFTSSTEEFTFAIFKGSAIQGSSKSRYSLPNIVLGTLGLQSIYFATNMQTGVVGLANKYYDVVYETSLGINVVIPFNLNNFNRTLKSGGRCSRPLNCGGTYNDYIYYTQNQHVMDSGSSRTLRISSNTCSSPSCVNYFYAALGDDGETCVVRIDYYLVGVLMIVAFVLCDISSFILGEYTGLVQNLHNINTQPYHALQSAQGPRGAIGENEGELVGIDIDHYNIYSADSYSSLFRRVRTSGLQAIVRGRYLVHIYVDRPVVLALGAAAAFVVDQFAHKKRR